ncbi:ROK family protein [Antribacter sp. KLBMP9083]|uniref:ROK family protein n=1 Tax=Antribacter soli TaxID=2910976 RepID=A0AA41QH47_9MICO|nr:ROK family protein [Antribacter soli]MCF4123370.1 ROK family protein [Antribacter soli]
MEPRGDLTPLVRIDVGGTWVRIDSDGALRRTPAPSRINHPDVPAPALVDRLLDQLVSAAPDTGRVVVSLGAATDDVTGTVRGSGPLWGDWRMDRDLVGELRRARPGVEWHVFNDVTCGLADFAESVAHESPASVGYLTISSGIGLKIADLGTRTVKVDDDGLQGEVGHLPAVLPLEQAHLGRLPCECGGSGHLASIGSGPGIARVAAALGVGRYSTDWFRDALAAGDEEAGTLLATVTRPVAELLRTIWVTQPWMAVVGIGGGVVEGVGAAYRSALLTHLRDAGGYAAGSPDAWERRVRLLDRPGVDVLRGAQLLAERSLVVTRAQEVVSTP